MRQGLTRQAGRGYRDGSGTTAPVNTARHDAAASQPVVITPPRGISVNLRELWAYRELALILTQRVIKPLYRQTLLGFGWAILPPFVLMVVFSVFFHNVAGVPSERGIPYPIFSYSGLLIWQYFTVATTTGANGLVANASFLTKIHFPRLLIPISSVLAALFNLAVSFLVLIGLMVYYGFVPTWQIVLLPVWILMAGATALGLALWLSAASVRYRDLALAVPLVLQAAMFATPVIYPARIFSGGWQTVLELVNPMAPIIDAFRWSVLGRGPAPGWHLGAAATVIAAALAGGTLFFNRMERTFADVV